MKKYFSLFTFFFFSFSFFIAFADDLPQGQPDQLQQVNDSSASDVPDTSNNTSTSKQSFHIDTNFQTVSPDRFYKFVGSKANLGSNRKRTFGRSTQTVNFDLLQTLDKHIRIGDKKEEPVVQEAGKIPVSQFRVENNPVRATYSNVRELSNINNNFIDLSTSRANQLQYRYRTDSPPQNTETVIKTSQLNLHPGADNSDQIEKNAITSRNNLTRKNYTMTNILQKKYRDLSLPSDSSAPQTTQPDDASFWKKITKGQNNY